MPASFPTIAPPMVQLNTYFGTSRPEDREKFHEKARFLIASVDSDQDETGRWVQLWEHRTKDSGLCRIEIGRKSPDRWVPPRDSELQPIVDAIVQLEGMVGHVHVQAAFRTDPSKLPKKNYINLLAGVEMNFDGVGASMAGGRFLLSHSFINELNWRIDGNVLAVEIEATRSDAQVSLEIIGGIEQELMMAFNRFVLEAKEATL